MIVAGGIWAAVAWADVAEFKIQKPSGQYVTVQVDEDDQSTYKAYRYDGVTKSGRSLSSVLAAIGFKDKAWTSVTVEGLTVRNGEFPNKKPAIFIVRGDDDLTFYRPKTENGPAETRNGIGVMTFRVPIDIEASDNSPKAGQTVTYSASVRGGGTGNYEFTWTPSSGTGGTGTTFKYTYPETTQEVTINVTAKRGSDSQTIGTSATSTVKIEAPPPDTSGTGDSSYNPPDYSSGYTPPSTDYSPNFPDTGDNTVPETPATPDPDEAPPIEDTGVSVAGELLSATAPLPPSSGDALPPGETAPPDPEAAIEEAEEISAPGALIAGGIVVGLIGLGAGREIENVRPRRWRRPDLSRLRRLSPPWK